MKKYHKRMGSTGEGFSIRKQNRVTIKLPKLSERVS